MKKIVFPLLLLFCVFSCQKEEVHLEEEAIQTPTLKNLDTDEEDYSPREIMEINLRWVSYITGSVLRDNPEARLEITALLQNGNSVVKLHEVLDNTTVFADRFYQNTSFYLFMGYPNHDKTRPNPPPQGIGEGHLNLTDQFINYILYEHCIELYFPKSMNYSGNFSITTTAHPMNATDNFNDGIIRYYNPLILNMDTEDFYSTTHNVTVTEAYVQNKDNVIIARPYRIPNKPIGGKNCNYTQYNDIEYFTDFLAY